MSTYNPDSSSSAGYGRGSWSEYYGSQTPTRTYYTCEIPGCACKRPTKAELEQRKLNEIRMNNQGIPAVPSVEDESPAQNIIAQANFLLGFLVIEASKYRATVGQSDWGVELGALLTEKEFEAAKKVIRQKLPTPEGTTIPVVGIVPAGTSIAKDETPLKDPALAINMLKTTDRIIQCGRGRGKALVILNADTLPSDTVVPEEMTKVAVSSESQEDIEVIMGNDVPNLLRAARDEYRNLKRAKEEAERNLREANNKIQELEVQLEAKDAEIDSWQRRVNQAALTTWQ